MLKILNFLKYGSYRFKSLKINYIFTIGSHLSPHQKIKSFNHVLPHRQFSEKNFLHTNNTFSLSPTAVKVKKILLNSILFSLCGKKGLTKESGIPDPGGHEFHI